MMEMIRPSTRVKMWMNCFPSKFQVDQKRKSVHGDSKMKFFEHRKMMSELKKKVLKVFDESWC